MFDATFQLPFMDFPMHPTPPVTQAPLAQDGDVQMDQPVRHERFYAMDPALRDPVILMVCHRSPSGDRITMILHRQETPFTACHATPFPPKVTSGQACHLWMSMGPLMVKRMITPSSFPRRSQQRILMCFCHMKYSAFV